MAKISSQSTSGKKKVSIHLTVKEKVWFKTALIVESILFIGVIGGLMAVGVMGTESVTATTTGVPYPMENWDPHVFPQDYNGQSAYVGQFVAGNGSLEVAIVSEGYGGQMGIVNARTGKMLSGWPKTAGRYTTVADMDGNGTQEIVTAYTSYTTMDETSVFHAVNILKADGTSWPNWPKTLTVSSAPNVVDLNGDGQQEIVIVSTDKKMYAYKLDGTELTGWPVTLPYDTAVNGSTLTSADVNNDQLPEIVVSSGYGFLTYRSTGGAPLWDIGRTASQSSSSGLTIRDINNDNIPEILYITAAHKVYALNGTTGAILAGWPKSWTVPAIQGQFTDNEPIDLTVADINGDNHQEVMAVSIDGYVYVWDGTSTTNTQLAGWPKVATGVTPAIPADVDHDGLSELIIGTKVGMIHAWNADGTEPSGWPIMQSAYGIRVADVNIDGKLELLFQTGNAFNIYTIPDATTTTWMPWPMAGNNSQRSNTAHCPLLTNAAAKPLVEMSLRNADNIHGVVPVVAYAKNGDCGAPSSIRLYRDNETTPVATVAGAEQLVYSFDTNGANNLVKFAAKVTSRGGVESTTNQITAIMDNTAPTINAIKQVWTYSYPAFREDTGSILLRDRQLEVDTEDSNGIVDVKFYLDGVYQTTVTTAPYRYVPPTDLAEGNHDFTAVARDTAGNEATATKTLYVDRTGPTITVISPQSNAVLSGTAVKISATAVDAKSGVAGMLTYKLTPPCVPDNPAIPCPFGMVPEGLTSTYSTNETSHLDSFKIPNGSATLQISGTDGSGNKTTISVPVTINNPEDKTPPQVTISVEQCGVDAVAPELIEYCTNNGPLLAGLRRATATVNDANRVTDVSYYLVAGSVETSIKPYLNQGYFVTPYKSYADFLTGSVKSDGSYLYPDGTYTLKARATDRAGNVGEATWPTPIVIQHGATPKVTLNIPNGAVITTGTVLEANIDPVKKALKVQFVLDDGEEILGGDSLYNSQLPPAPPYRFTYDPNNNKPGSKVPDGVYKLSAYIYTEVGLNVAYSSPPVTVTIDNTTHDPIYPLGHTAARAHGSYLGFNGSEKSFFDLSLRGTTQIVAQAWGENGIEWVEYYVDSGQPMVRLNQPPYEYNWDTTTVANGEHYVHIRYQDRKGNVWDDNVRQYVLNGSRSYMRLIAPTTKTVVSGTIPLVCEIVPGDIPLSYNRSVCDGLKNDLVGNYTVGHTVAEWFDPDPTKHPGDVEYLPGGVIRLSLRDGFDTTKLPDGINYMSLFFTDASGARFLSEPAVLNVENTRPHGVVFTAPENAATVSGNNVQFKVNDIQLFGTAEKIEWYRDGKLIDQDENVISDLVRMNEYAYEYSWNSTGVPNGSHVIMVKTYSADGHVNSAEITVNVQNPEASIGLPLVARLYQPTSTEVVMARMCLLEITQGVETLEYAKWYQDGQIYGAGRYTTPASYDINYAAIFASQQNLPGTHTYKVELSNRAGVVMTSECSLTTPVPLESYVPTVSFEKPPADSSFTNTRTVYFEKHQNSLYAPEADTIIDLSIDGRVVRSSGNRSFYPFYVWDTKTAVDGSHQMLLKITDAGGRSNSATISYTTKNSPQVEFAAPANNATVTGDIELKATATSGYATERVKFYRGDTLLGEDNFYPFAVNWNTASVANGPYTIKAVSTDRNNKEATATIQVTVSNDVVVTPTAPTVQITSPANGETFDRTVNITATTTGDQIERVEFYDGTTLIGTDTNAPYVFLWNTADVANGSRTLTAKVFGLGGTTTSSPVTITINHLPPPDTTPPVVRITAPAANAQVRGVITISAEATDAGGIREVQFYRASDTLLGIDRDAPYSIQWDTTTVENNDKLLQVTAIDNAGNSKRVDVTIYVNNPVVEPIPPKPTVSLLINHNVPASSIVLSGQVPLAAALSATTGVEYVKFVLDANNFNTDTIAPYEVTMDSVRFTNGTHTLKAVAYGRFGNAESQVVNVTINNNTTTTTAPVFTVKLPTLNIMTGTRTITVKPATKLPVKVDCYLNGALVATDVVAPYYCKWNSRVVPNGTYTWKTVVTNAQGQQTSKEASVTTKNSLRVYWRTPLSKATVKGVVVMNPLILGGNGLSKLEYILDKGTTKVKTLASITTTSYGFSWDTTSATVGRHRLTVRGTDKVTGRTSSQTITVTVTR